MRKLYACVIALCLCQVDASAQNYGELNINDVHVRFYSNGRVAFDTLDNNSYSEVPAGQGVNAIYAGGLWIGGQTSGGSVLASTTLYDNDHNMHFFPGPLTMSGGTTDATVSAAYDQVWSVTQAEISAHLAWANCNGDPGCLAALFPNGYTVPSSFFDWPAMGDVGNGYALYLAPFFDYNQDGDYDPYSGDVPCIMGDQALFSVFSDYLGSTNLNQPMGVEVRQMPFAYSSGDPFLDQTVFMRYKVINWSSQVYANTMLGFFNDFDLGCGEDDFIGCDPSRNLAYVYNWDEEDQNCLGTLGYGQQPPAFGMVLLKGPFMDADGLDNPVGDLLPAFNGLGFDDGFVDNERHGLSRFVYFNREASSCCNDPYTTPDHYNYLRGIWKDGTPMSYGGNGYDQDPNALQCAYMYPGNGDPVGAGTNGVVQAPWSETAPTPATPDRRGLMSMGSFTLSPGQFMDILFAYVYARAESGGALASVAALQARVDSVREFANTLPIWDKVETSWVGQCRDYASVGMGDIPAAEHLVLFPTPANTTVSFDARAELVGGSLTVRDALGRIVAQQRILPGRNIVEIGSLADGVYSCEGATVRARFTGRIVKE